MNKFTGIKVGNTLKWAKAEKNLIYLLAELIDNSKASYENNEKRQLNLDDKPIILEFNEKEKFIKVTDFAEGMNIEKALDSIGREEEQKSQTNQHFIGLKSCLNFFTNFSIIVSERTIEGLNKRELNIFIYGKGKMEKNYNLKPKNVTGTEIFMFRKSEDFLECLKKFDFIDNDVYEEILGLNFIEEINEESSTTVEDILCDLNIATKLIRTSLAMRYAYTANNLKGFRIEYIVINSRGEDITNDEQSQSNVSFYNQVSVNNWENLYSFNAKNFIDSNRSWEFVLSNENPNKDLFLKEFEALLFNEVKSHSSKMNSRYKKSFEDFSKGLEMESYNKIYSFDDEKWKDFTLARNFLEKFLNNLLLKSEEGYEFKINIKNLINTNDKNLEYTFKTSDTSDKVMDINYTFFIFSEKYKRIDFEPKNKILWRFESPHNKRKDFTGFDVILNNRAVFHGPNINSNSSKTTVVSQDNPPNKFIKEFLWNSSSDEFPNYNKTSPVSPKIGGNSLGPSAALFGRLVLQEGKIFTTGYNKSVIKNIDILENFTKKLLASSCINVLLRLVHQFSNQEHNTDNEKTVIGYISNKVKNKLKELNETTSKKNDFIETIKSLKKDEKENLLLLANEISNLENNNKKNNKETLSTELADDYFYYKDFTFSKIMENLINRLSLFVNTKKYSLNICENEKIIININKKWCKSWENKIELIFIKSDFQFIEYTFDEGEVFTIKINLMRPLNDNMIDIIFSKFLFKMLLRVEVLNDLPDVILSELKKNDLSEKVIESMLTSLENGVEKNG